jgi:hypothetical protein
MEDGCTEHMAGRLTPLSLGNDFLAFSTFCEVRTGVWRGITEFLWILVQCDAVSQTVARGCVNLFGVGNIRVGTQKMHVYRSRIQLSCNVNFGIESVNLSVFTQS